MKHPAAQIPAKAAPVSRPPLAKEPSKPRDGKRLALASISAFGVFMLGAGLSCLAQLVAVRLLGPDHFGEYAYVTATIMLLAGLSTLGFQVALLRLLPAYASRQEWSHARGVTHFAHFVSAATGIAIALGAAWLVRNYLWAERPALAQAFLIGLAALPFLGLQLIAASVARAFGAVALALAPERIVRDAGLLLVLAGAAWSGQVRMDAVTATCALLTGALLSFVLAELAARRFRPAELAGHAPRYLVKEWSALVAPLIILTLADNLISRCGPLVLGMSGRTREAGIFAIALGLAQLAAMPRMAVATLFAPTVSDLHARGDRAGLQALTTRAAWFSLFGTACIATLLLMGTPALLAWLGPAFNEGLPVAVILIAGQVLCAGFGPQQHLITMTGHERMAATLMALAAIGSFLLCLFVVERLGMLGIATVMAIGLVAWNIAMAHFIRTRLDVLPGLVASFVGPAGTPRMRGSEISVDCHTIERRAEKPRCLSPTDTSR